MRHLQLQPLHCVWLIFNGTNSCREHGLQKQTHLVELTNNNYIIIIQTWQVLRESQLYCIIVLLRLEQTALHLDNSEIDNYIKCLSHEIQEVDSRDMCDLVGSEPGNKMPFEHLECCSACCLCFPDLLSYYMRTHLLSVNTSCPFKVISLSWYVSVQKKKKGQDANIQVLYTSSSLYLKQYSVKQKAHTHVSQMTVRQHDYQILFVLFSANIWDIGN